MLRRSTSIIMFVVLGNAAASAPLWAGSSRSTHHHCEMARTPTGTLVSCCQHAPVPDSEQTGKMGLACCQISAPWPDDQTRATVPGNASEELRLQTHAQLLKSSEPVSPSALAPLAPGWVSSTTGFRLDRSDTYLLASAFRI